MRFTSVFETLGALFAVVASTQQYAGEVIDTKLPIVPGAEIAFFKIPGVTDGTKPKAANLTLINYYSHGSNDKRLVESKVQRAVIIVHGLNRDPGTYQANMQSALAQFTGDSNINKDSVAILAPYFPNGDDKDTGGYPWNATLKAGGARSYTSAMVWKGSQWSAGGNNQYPYLSTSTSSYTVLDTLVQYFDNKSLFPNMKQIIVAGHSLGAQTVHRYAAIGNNLNTNSPVAYWIANPNSYVWLSLDRPLSTASCPTYDVYRDGYTNFTEYPMTYGQSLVIQGRSAILANYNRKQIAYARGTQDKGDDSSNCAPFTAGVNRHERFFNFIKAFPATCNDPHSNQCDTVDLVNVGHDAAGMMLDPAGQARLFVDNFYGNGNRSYDFGYPRLEIGDDPYSNPALNTSSSAINNNTYAGNLTYAGCWSDAGQYHSLQTLAYDNSSNTIESCTSTCVSQGFSIAGLELGSQCYCGKYLTTGTSKVIESSCTMGCAGNSSETCGNVQRLSIFSNGAPYVLPPAGTPETVGNFTFSNCYTDTSPRTLSGKSSSGSFMTLDYCADFCSGYKYFVTEYGAECYCSNSINPAGTIAASSDCSMTCANNTLQYCSAGNRLTLYTNPDATGTPVSSTTTSASTPGASSANNGPSCPASDGTVVKSNGLNFTVECGIDHAAGDLTTVYVSSFQECIDACSSNSKCVDVSLSGTACYLKQVLGAATNSPSIWGAKLNAGVTSSVSSTATSSTASSASQSGSAISVSFSSASSSPASSVASSVASSATASPSNIACPASDGTTYVGSSGRKFTIECGIDHQAGDMGSKTVNSFQECIDACDQTTGCVDVSLSGSACYLKNSLGPAVSAAYVSGAKLASPASSVGSSSVSTSVSTSVSSSSTSASTTVSQSSASISTSASASATPSVLSCPASNNTVYTVASGSSFLIECGIDHQGGDLSSKAVNSFAECVTTCDTTLSCVDVALSGNMCYLKSSVGGVVKLDYISGAKLIPASSSSSISSSAAPSSSSGSSSSSLSSLSSSTSMVSSSISTSASSTLSATTSASSSTASASQSSSLVSSVSPISSASSQTSSSSASSDSASQSQSFSTSSASVPSATSPSGTPSSSSSVVSSSSSLASTVSIPSSTLSSSTPASSISSSAASSPSSSVSSSSALSGSSSTISSSASLSSSSGFATSISTTASSAVSSTPASLPSGFSYAGCFIDSSSTRALPVSIGASSTQTQQQCAMSCQTKGYKYSGTEYANECWCGNSAPSSPAPESQCSMACKGDSTQKCGAGNRLSVVSDDSWKQTFFATQKSGPWNLAGCYTDSTAKRSLANSVSLAAYGGDANATISNCVQACQARGFTYCGAEYYSECYGSNTAPTTSLATGSDPIAAGCNCPCKGNSSESCGGSSRIIVYTTNVA